MLHLRQGLHFARDRAVQALENVLVAPGARERVQSMGMSRRGWLSPETVTADGRTSRAVERTRTGGVVIAQVAVQHVIAGEADVAGTQILIRRVFGQRRGKGGAAGQIRRATIHHRGFAEGWIRRRRVGRHRRQQGTLLGVDVLLLRHRRIFERKHYVIDVGVELLLVLLYLRSGDLTRVDGRQTGRRRQGRRKRRRW